MKIKIRIKLAAHIFINFSVRVSESIMRLAKTHFRRRGDVEGSLYGILGLCQMEIWMMSIDTRGRLPDTFQRE